MKISKLLIVCVLTLCISAKTSGAFTTSKIIHSTTIATDSVLQVQVIKLSSSKMNAQVSFNGNEGTTGKMKIYNSSHQLVIQFTIDLKHAPLFTKINLNEFAPGTYTFELTTSMGVHTSTILI